MLIAFQKLNITIVIIRHVIFDKLIIKLPINILIGIRQAGVAIIGEGIRVFVGLSTRRHVHSKYYPRSWA